MKHIQHYDLMAIIMLISRRCSLKWQNDSLVFQQSRRGSNNKCRNCFSRSVTSGGKAVQKQEEVKHLTARITDGLPVFRLVDWEYDSWCGGLLLDGSQEGEFAFAPEELHHFLCDVGRGLNSSADIWKRRSLAFNNCLLATCILSSHFTEERSKKAITWNKNTKWYVWFILIWFNSI